MKGEFIIATRQTDYLAVTKTDCYFFATHFVENIIARIDTGILCF